MLGILPSKAGVVVSPGGLPGHLQRAAAVVRLDDAVVGIGVPLDVHGRLDPQVEDGKQRDGDERLGGHAGAVRGERGQAQGGDQDDGRGGHSREP